MNFEYDFEYKITRLLQMWVHASAVLDGRTQKKWERVSEEDEERI